MSNSYNFSDKDNGIIHVAYMRSDLSDDYNRHTGASMASVLEYCSKPVVFHIFHEEILSFKNRDAAEENMNKFRELADKYGAEVEFHNVVFPDGIEKCMSSTALARFPRILLGRIYLPELLPNVSTAVSLGSDVIVKTDLVQLTNCLSKEKAMASSMDPMALNAISHNHSTVFGLKWRDYVLSHEINPNQYICTDIVIYNLEYMRHNLMLSDKAIEYMNQYHDLQYGDQDITNALYNRHTQILPQNYDIFLYTLQNADKLIDECIKNDTGYIIHYAGTYKPWAGYHSKYEMEYWYYLSLTPWGNNGKVFNLMKEAFHTENEAFEFGYSSYIWTKPLHMKVKLLGNIFIDLFIRYLHKII